VQLDDPRYVQTGEKSDVIAALVRTGETMISTLEKSDGAPAPLWGEGTRRRAPSARQPHDIASGDKRGVAVLHET
jgi:hypothetical protein